MGRDDDGTGPPRRPARDEVERLLAERGEHLMRAAVALTGNRSDGEDLLQAALERLLRHWGRIEGDAEGYLRRTLYNMAADGWRRRGAWLRKLPLIHAGGRGIRHSCQPVRLLSQGSCSGRQCRRLHSVPDLAPA